VISLSAASSTRSSRLKRFLSGGVVALVTGGLLATGMTSVASAEPGDPTFAVHVTAGSEAVVGARVELLADYGDGAGFEYASSEYTDDSGEVFFDEDDYLYTGVDYAVSITKDTYTTPLSGQGYANGFLKGLTGITTADFDTNYPVVLSEGANSVDVALTEGAYLSGEIRDPEGAPTTVAHTATAYRKSTDINTGAVQWDFEGTVSLDEPSSVYGITGLRDGEYVVEFDQYAESTWAYAVFNEGYASADEAPAVATTLESTGVINGQFVTGETITGTLSLPEGYTISSQYDLNMFVYKQKTDGTPDLSSTSNINGQVNEDGTYTTNPIVPGDYFIKFDSTIDGIYGEWYNNAASGRTATAVASGSTGVDATLGTGFTLTVTANSTTGPVAGADVRLYGVGNFEYYDAITGANGKAVFTSIEPDDYEVLVYNPDFDVESRYATLDGVGTVNKNDLDLIGGVEGSVSAAVTFPGVATQTLTLTDPAGKPVTNAYIEAIQVKDGERVGNDYLGATKVPGKSGVYTFALEANADYTILVDPYPSTTSYAQYLGGVPAYGEYALRDAKTFNSGTGGTIAFQLASSGVIKGVVKSTAKKALPGVSVTVFEHNGDDWIYSSGGYTSKTGAYSVSVRPGSYKVGFSTSQGASNAYIGDYSYNATDFDDLATVYVGKSSSATVNKTLVAGGSITGTIANTSGVAVAGVYVTPVLIDGSARVPFYSGTGYTSSKGAFTLKGLPSGTYALSFDDEYDGRVGDTYTEQGSVVTYKVTAGKVTKIAGKLQLPSNAATKTATVTTTLASAADGSAGWIDFQSTDGLHYGSVEFDGSAPVSINLVPGVYDYTVEFDEDNAIAYRALRGNLGADVGETTLDLTAIEKDPLSFINTPSVQSYGDNGVGNSYLYVDAEYDYDRVQASYQWLRDGIPIFGATNGGYSPVGSDAGTTISVRVTLDNKFTPGSPSYQSTVVMLDGIAITAGPAVYISGDVYLDATKTSPGGIVRINRYSVDAETGSTLSYQWYRGEEPILGQTGATYTLVTSDIDQMITARIVASKLGRADSGEVTTFGLLGTKNPAATNTKKPTVSATTTGVPAGSTKYTATPGTWSVKATTSSYVWFVDSEQVGTGMSYTANAEVAAAAAIWVQVTAKKDDTYENSAPVAVLARKGTAPAQTLFAPFVENALTEQVIAADTIVPVGTVLGAASAFSDQVGGMPALSYVWQRQTGTKWAAIAKATARTYTVTTADASKNLRVLITAKPSYYATTVFTADAGVGSLRNELVEERAGSVSIEGTAAATSTVTASITLPEAPLAGVKNAYQWGTLTGDVFAPISKATKATYVVPASLVGKDLAVRVTATKATYTTSVVTSAATTVTLNVITASSDTAITGTPAVGAKLTAKPAAVDVASVTRSYVWEKLVGEEWETVATSSTYTPVVADLGSRIRVTESITKAGHNVVTSVASDVEIGLGTLATVTAAKVVTSTSAYTVSAGATSPAGVVSYRWYVNGEATENTSTIYPRSSSDAGKLIAVDVTVELEGYQNKYTAVIAQKAAAPVFEQPVTVVNVKVGEFAQISGPEPTLPAGISSSPTYAFQYLLDGKAIKGANDFSYQPTGTQAGKKLSLRITVTSPEFTTATYTTAAVVIALGAPASEDIWLGSSGVLVGSVVSGTGEVPSGYTATYAWYRENEDGTVVAIPKATKISYKTVAADVESYISLRVTFKRTGYESLTYTAGWAYVFGTDGLDANVAPALTGTGAAGSVLTVTPGSWTVAPTLSYTWYRNGEVILGVTGSKFTPLGNHVGDTISVRIIAKRAGFDSVYLYTNEIKVIAGAAPTIVGTAIPKVTGTAQTCETFSTSTGTWKGDNLSFEYQWYLIQGSSKQLIEGATKSTYTALPSDAASQLRVIVTAKSPGYETGISGSATTPVLTAGVGCATE
jgi:hypothetical protein